MRLKKVISLGIILSMSILTIGCGTAKSDSTNNTSSTTQYAESQKEQEERVVASSVAVVQILDALGVSMVGVPTTSYDLPDSVKDVTQIGNPMSPDMEVISSLNPSIIVSVDSLSEELKNQFETLKIESEFVNLNSYDGLKESINSLGKRFSKEDKADELLSTFNEKEITITSSIEGKESPSVMILFGTGENFMVASEASYVGSLVSKAGGKNVVENAPGSFIPVDMEYLAEKNPDYILLMTHANPEESLNALKAEFDTNDAWKNFDAVKSDKVIALESSYFGMSANLLAIDAIEKLVNILYEA